MSRIHLIRHGQSEFNAAYTGNGDVMIFDAPLTDLGHAQAKATRAAVVDLGIETVICSPLTRAIQTARHIFPATEMHVHAEAREHLAHSCDVGVAPAQLQAVFPDMEFGHLPDVWWHQGPLNDLGIPVEPWDVFDIRMARLKAELQAWRGRPLAVVCHGHVIRGLTGINPDNCEIVELTT